MFVGTPLKFLITNSLPKIIAFPTKRFVIPEEKFRRNRPRTWVKYVPH